MTSRTILSCFPARIFRVFLDDQFVLLRMPQKHSSFRILTLSCQDESMFLILSTWLIWSMSRRILISMISSCVLPTLDPV